VLSSTSAAQRGITRLAADLQSVHRSIDTARLIALSGGLPDDHDLTSPALPVNSSLPTARRDALASAAALSAAVAAAMGNGALGLPQQPESATARTPGFLPTTPPARRPGLMESFTPALTAQIGEQVGEQYDARW
jgi:hypothetical protein